MKALLIFSIIVLVGCAAIDRRTTSASPSRNLTVAEVRDLPVGISFEEVARRLRYFTRAAIDLPLVSFAVDGESETKCVMSYDIESGRLRYAWIQRKKAEPEVVWPKSAAGTKLSGIEDIFVDEKRANHQSQCGPKARMAHLER